MRLLLVEDEAAIAIRTRESLEEAGYTVDWARDGVEALALAQEREYAAPGPGPGWSASGRPRSDISRVSHRLLVKLLFFRLCKQGSYDND